ncbi:MAG: protein kinase [Myxococcota bacterium]|nr:protein kinase [Myxococcota bacterium]
MLVLDEWLSSAQQSHERELTHNPVPEPGSVIAGCYRVVRLLGTGAMGVVLLAEDESLQRRVAIKFIRPTLAGPSFRDRFLDEARAMARVSHPNVLQVHAFGEQDEAPYFVMEFVEGFTLTQWLADRSAPLNLDVALRILDGLCLGVAAIHAQNTVHHDIKPANILLDDTLRPRVADLGLAALHRQDQPSGSEVLGTPAYMAPEIAFSRDSDPALRPRADVYSLACVAYELLTGRPPFDGSGSAGLLLQHAMRAVLPPSSLCARVPKKLDRAVLRALEKDPRARTPSIDAFRRDLVAARWGTLEPERILVAEDDDASRHAMRALLETAFPNAELECVADGQLALEAFERKPPSVAILDLQMPGIDGMHLTRLFRERGTEGMPILVLTGFGGPDEWRQLAALGADRLLVKPVVADDVVALIRRTLGERSASARQFVA